MYYSIMLGKKLAWNASRILRIFPTTYLIIISRFAYSTKPIQYMHMARTKYECDVRSLIGRPTRQTDHPIQPHNVNNINIQLAWCSVL